LAEIVCGSQELFERGAIEVLGDLLVFRKQVDQRPPVAITWRQMS